MVPTLHMVSVYALLSEFSGISFIASAPLTRLKHLLHNASIGRYGSDIARSIRVAASSSIDTVLPAKSLELKHTMHLIKVLPEEINEIEVAINAILDTIDSPMTTIPEIKTDRCHDHS